MGNDDQAEKEKKVDQPQKPDEKAEEPKELKTIAPPEPPTPSQKKILTPPPPAPPQSPVKKSKLEKSSTKPKVNESPRKDKAKALTEEKEKETEKTEKDKRKRKRERKEEVIVHGPSQPIKSLPSSSVTANEKKIDSLSQIISESDSEGKESTKRAACEGEYQVQSELLRPLSLDKVTLKDISLRHQLNVKTEQNGRL